jgi:hypothetical protein
MSLSGSSVVRPTAQPRKGKGLHVLLRELSDDEDNMDMDTGLDVPDDPERPWLRDYKAYMDVVEQVREGPGWSVIQWWGVRFHLRLGYLVIGS